MMSPFGIALEPGRTVVVADGTNGLLRVDPVAGTATTLASGDQLIFPLGVALAPDGNVFVGDVGGMVGQSSRLVRVEASSGVQTLLTTNVLVPAGLAFEGSGDLLVVDTVVGGGGIDKVFRVDPTNGNLTLLTASNFLGGAIGLTVGSNQTIYVANMTSNSIVSVDPVTGVQSLFASGGPLVRPMSITVVPNPNLNRLLEIQVGVAQVELLYQGLAGLSYTLERSTNLLVWKQITNVSAAANGQVQFKDPSPPAVSAFYRVRLP